MHIRGSSANVPCLPRFWNCYKTLTLWSLLGRCRIHCACHEQRRLNVQNGPNVVRLQFSLETCFAQTAACTFSTSQLPKVIRSWSVFNNILASDCPSRPQPCALFDHWNFQKWSESEVFEKFDFEISSRHNCRHLFDISAAKLLRTWGALSFFTSKCASHASHHNSMQFFISHPATWLRTCRFSEPTFRPSGATNIGNTQCFATFLHFRHLDLLSSGFFSSLTALTTVATSVHRSEVWLLNFLRSMNMWTDESMTQWIKKPTNQWICESLTHASMNGWISEPMSQRINEPVNHAVNQWSSESMIQWTQEPMNQLMIESASRWMYQGFCEPMNQWINESACESRNQWVNEFAEQPLIWASSSLARFCSELPPMG